MERRSEGACPQRWSRAGGVLWRHSFGELIALGDGVGDRPVRLNATCAALWHHLAEPASIDELVGDLAARFDTEPAAIEHEVSAVLSHLADLGLVVRR